MKEVKVQILLPFVTGKKSFDSGEVTSLDEEVAYLLAKKNVVEFVDNKQFNALDKAKTKAEAEAKAKEEAEKAKVNAILRQSEIQNDLNALYLAVVEKEAELNGVVLNESETIAAVESIAKREASKKK